MPIDQYVTAVSEIPLPGDAERLHLRRSSRQERGGIVLKALVLIALAGLVFVTMQLFANRSPSPDFDSFLLAGERYQVQIYRDDFGVPHIYGKSDADTAFGLAYAHAEDDFKTIQEVLLATRGQLAAVMGQDAAVTDYLVGMMGVWEAVDAGYETQLTQQTRDIAEAYAHGINVYGAQHPEQVMPFALPVSGKDIVAGFTFKTPLFYGFDEVVGALFDGTGERELAVQGEQALRFTDRPQPETGSQGVAIAPSRSDDGHTRLLVNSHQPLTGPVAWYEARLHSEQGWDVAGGTFPGSPLILHGHNRHLGWSNTVNKPDLVDIYRLEMDPADENRYRLDGQWRELEQHELPITVKLAGPLRWTFKQTLYRSEHGPVLKLPQGTFALRWSGMGEIRMLEQMLAINTAQNMEEFERALAILAQPSINYVYADREGNIAHYYNAAFPARQEGWDWSKDLPGDRSDLIWSRYLPFENIPMTRNPPSGVVFNANNTPYVSSIGEGQPEPGDFSATLGIETQMTNRAYRLKRLLATEERISSDAFRAIKYDLHYDPDLPAVVELRELLAAGVPESHPQLGTAYELLAGWDLSTEKASRAAVLAYLTMESRLDFRVRDESVDLVDAMSDAVAYLEQHFGRMDPPWGDYYRHRRGKGDWPIDGGPDILRAVYGELEEESGRQINVAGDSYIMFVEWDQEGRVSSRSSHSFGSATLDVDSLHYDDQVELFLAMEEKPVYLDKAQLMQHLSRSYSPLSPEG